MAKNKSGIRIGIITGLFILAALIFSLITLQGIWRINQYDKNFQPVSDAPGVCYDEKDNGSVRDNSYPCYTYDDYDGHDGHSAEVNDDNDRAMFLYDNIVFIGKTQTMQMRVVMVVISSILSVASLFGAVIYFCHNKS